MPALVIVHAATGTAPVARSPIVRGNLRPIDTTLRPWTRTLRTDFSNAGKVVGRVRAHRADAYRLVLLMGAHCTTFVALKAVERPRCRVVHGGGRWSPVTNRPSAAVGNPCSQCGGSANLTRCVSHGDGVDRLPCPRVDCQGCWPRDGPYETRGTRGAGRPRWATGCSAKVCSQERRPMSDPPSLPTRQVIPQLAGGCP